MMKNSKENVLSDDFEKYGKGQGKCPLFLRIFLSEGKNSLGKWLSDEKAVWENVLPHGLLRGGEPELDSVHIHHTGGRVPHKYVHHTSRIKINIKHNSLRC
jgi:hypothetical protein